MREFSFGLRIMLLPALLVISSSVLAQAVAVAQANQEQVSPAAINQATVKIDYANSLYARMGGTPVVTKIVDDFINTVTKDARTKRSFDGLNLKTLKGSIVSHICQLTGGGCVYEGETMVNAHRDANITEAEFDAFVGMFRQTLNQYLPTAEKNALLKILAPMKRDIVMPQHGHPPNPNNVPATVSPQ